MHHSTKWALNEKEHAMRARISLMGFICLTALACGGSVKAPQLADGSKITLFIYVDRGINEKTPDDKKAKLNELGEWMERDIVRTFKEGGYEVKLIESRGDYTYGKNEYLMTFEIDKYEPADAAYEAERGLGAGIVSIDAYAELFKDSDKPLLKRKDGVSSGRDWTYVAGKVNQKILPDMSERIHELQ